MDKARVLKGLSLQGLTYLLLLREWSKERRHPRSDEPFARMAFLTVHPSAASDAPHVLDVDAYEESWSETLGVLDSTWRAGAFGLRKGGCDWCDFRAACRRDHAPTRARLGLIEEWSDYMLSAGKSTLKNALRLKDIRAKQLAGSPGDDEGNS